MPKNTAFSAPYHAIVHPPVVGQTLGARFSNFLSTRTMPLSPLSVKITFVFKRLEANNLFVFPSSPPSPFYTMANTTTTTNINTLIRMCPVFDQRVQARLSAICLPDNQWLDDRRTAAILRAVPFYRRRPTSEGARHVFEGYRRFLDLLEAQMERVAAVEHEVEMEMAQERAEVEREMAQERAEAWEGRLRLYEGPLRR